jgi:hypothetical protein
MNSRNLAPFWARSSSVAGGSSGFGSTRFFLGGGGGFALVLAGHTLYELKMVDRNLRSIDLRQVMIYAALNHESEQFDIANISILNPRRGLEYALNLEEFADHVARQTAAELCHKITNFLQDFESIHHAY